VSERETEKEKENLRARSKFAKKNSFS